MALSNTIKKIIILVTLLTFYQTTFAASLYDSKTSWIDTDKKDVSINVQKGFYTLVAMVYTGCAHACPMTISKIQEIEKDFAKNGFQNLKIVLASFDVKNDRPDKLKKYQETRKLDFKSWKFLAAKSESDARELAVSLGISYKDIGDGDFSHSNIITLLDPNGEILASIDNLNASSEGLLKALNESLQKKK